MEQPVLGGVLRGLTGLLYNDNQPCTATSTFFPRYATSTWPKPNIIYGPFLHAALCYPALLPVSGLVQYIRSSADLCNPMVSPIPCLFVGTCADSAELCIPCDIVRCCLTILNPDNMATAKTYTAPRAALSLLAEHAGQFATVRCLASMHTLFFPLFFSLFFSPPLFCSFLLASTNAVTAVPVA